MGEAARSIGDGLGPGEAFAVVLVEHSWAVALGDAVARTGGTEAAAEFVEVGGLSEVGGWSSWPGAEPRGSWCGAGQHPRVSRRGRM